MPCQLVPLSPRHDPWGADLVNGEAEDAAFAVTLRITEQPSLALTRCNVGLSTTYRNHPLLFRVLACLPLTVIAYCSFVCLRVLHRKVGDYKHGRGVLGARSRGHPGYYHARPALRR